MGPMSSKEQPSDHSIMGDGPTRSTACASTTFWRCSQRWLALAAVCRATRRPQRPPTPPAAVCTGDEYLGNQHTSTQPDHCAAGAGSTGSGASGPRRSAVRDVQVLRQMPAASARRAAKVSAEREQKREARESGRGWTRERMVLSVRRPKKRPAYLWSRVNRHSLGHLGFFCKRKKQLGDSAW